MNRWYDCTFEIYWYDCRAWNLFKIFWIRRINSFIFISLLFLKCIYHERSLLQAENPPDFRRSGTDQRASLENDSGRARKDMPRIDGTDPGVLPEAHRYLQNDLLQEHGARTALAGMRPKTDHRHPADHRVRQNGPWIHEALAGRPDCFIKGRYVPASA